MGFHGILSGFWFWQFTKTCTGTHFKSMVIWTNHPKYGWKTMIEPPASYSNWQTPTKKTGGYWSRVDISVRTPRAVDQMFYFFRVRTSSLIKQALLIRGWNGMIFVNPELTSRDLWSSTTILYCIHSAWRDSWFSQINTALGSNLACQWNWPCWCILHTKQSNTPVGDDPIWPYTYIKSTSIHIHEFHPNLPSRESWTPEPVLSCWPPFKILPQIIRMIWKMYSDLLIWKLRGYTDIHIWSFICMVYS